MKLVYKKAVSKTSGKNYDCVSVDLGYTSIPLTFDSGVIAQILDCTARELAAITVGTEKVLLTSEAAKK